MLYKLNTLYPIVPRTDNNAMVFSRLSAMQFREISSPAFGIKYILEGEEHYCMENNTYKVGAGQFLLANPHHRFSARIPDKQVATGLCIDVGSNLLNNVHYVSLTAETTLLDNGPYFPVTVSGLFENVEQASGTALGFQLHAITNALKNNQDIIIDPCLFYDAALAITALDKKAKTKMAAMGYVKTSTREELYRRVLQAKHIIDEGLFENLELDHLAKAASLSKFHLIRSFKKIVGQSPYQYHLHQKMKMAASLLLGNKEMPVDEIAIMLNFPDIHSFSKSFKKTHGCAPLIFRKGG